jgi:hypothetical protein
VFSFGLVTVTVHVDVLFPSSVVTVIVAVPASTAVTVPLALTVATDVLLLVHVTFLFVAFDGLIYETIVSVFPF